MSKMTIIIEAQKESNYSLQTSFYAKSKKDDSNKVEPLLLKKQKKAYFKLP